PAKDERAEAVALLGQIIGGGNSSRLDEALVRRQEIATSVSGFNLGLADGADMLVFIATGKPGGNPDSLEKAFLAELAGTSSFTQSELDRARASQRFNFFDGSSVMRRRSFHLTSLVLSAGVVGIASIASAQVVQPPAPGPLRHYEFPPVEQFSLSNGLRVILVEKHTLPEVEGRLILDA